ncbi:polyprenyl synthetase family protein [Fusibacter paucivorans]|uniref:Polyprenyl synthetase family protein n=1 Tax=Fusibacter paucivorans TaxID=76009 RepID=A0ABS5PQC5_9FIRM|nr:polyprenyl synthetase family protein [Fusibacter paucivorans]MBS7527369.1 polyprenyl synthetase family protein [Fusibacter paucivorans]
MSYNINEVSDSVASEIEKVKKRIKDHSQAKFQEVQIIIDAILKLNGKMLRPQFLIVSANFGTYESDRMVNLASAIELLHMATLVHDDIVDDAEIRRNQQSVQSKFGKDMAVYTGDYLLSKSLSVFKAKDYDNEKIAKLAKVIERICESELLQYFNRYHTMTVRNYLRVISGKTAALFSLSMYLGAVESGCSETLANSLGKIGYEIGIAFQIIDDILDFSTDAETVGKTVQHDVKNGYYTLPVIYAFEGQRVTFSQLSPLAIGMQIEQHDGIEKSRILARKYTDKAFQRIDRLPDVPYKSLLRNMAEKMLVRVY